LYGKIHVSNIWLSECTLKSFCRAQKILSQKFLFYGFIWNSRPLSVDHINFRDQIPFLGSEGLFLPCWFSKVYLILLHIRFRIDGYWCMMYVFIFSGIKSSWGFQKLGFGPSKPIPKYFCIWFRLTFVYFNFRLFHWFSLSIYVN
jgi:hypothetical protein